MKKRLLYASIAATVGFVWASTAASCGGRLLVWDMDGEASDAPSDQPYEGQWCNTGEWTTLDGGPTDTPGDASIFCGVNPYLDAWTYCRFVPGAISPWNCCGADDWECCPGAVNMMQHGTVLVGGCCGAATSPHYDCTPCCDGIGPGPYYTGQWDH